MAADLSDALDAAHDRVRGNVGIEVAQGASRRVAPGRTGVLVAGTEVGYVGELPPAVAAASDLLGRVIVAELDLDLVLSLAGERVVAASLSTFPAATQDVSSWCPRRRPRRAVRAALVEGQVPSWSPCAWSTTTAVRASRRA